MKSIETLSGINAAMTAALAERFLEDPRSVGEPWRSTFEALDRDAMTDLVGEEAVAVWEVRQGKNGRNGHAGGVSAAEAAAGWQAADRMRLDWAVRDLVDTYRRDGHRTANTNPLDKTAGGLHVDLAAFGLTQDDLGKPVNTDVPMPPGATVADLIGVLEATWCGTVGVEIAHIEDLEARRWLQNRIEATRCQPNLDRQERLEVLRGIDEATLIEEFVHRKFLGAKRFSLEGGESLIPMLQGLIESAGGNGASDIILGMAHRGRLNVMVNILGKTVEDLFMRFHDGDAKAHLGGGDVKYHHGLSRDIMTASGNEVHISLCFNPSHLEFVNPVVLGRARAKQDRAVDPSGKKVIPLLIHGDSAIVGQGVVYETLNLAGLEGYSSGGTLHIVVNNQIGFTTEPRDARTTRYCTDVARWIGAPVFHVNGDDPEAALMVARLAVEYRQTFGKDVFIDLVCYRRHGHNEGDEPRFTQPGMYALIDAHTTLRETYTERLRRDGILEEGAIEARQADWTKTHEEALGRSLERTDYPEVASLSGVWQPFIGGRDDKVPEIETAIDQKRLVRLLQGLCTPPEGFTIARKLRRFIQNRLAMASGERALDWGAAEALAFASLLEEGTPIRLSGQDAERGTFSHRHGVMTDPNTGQRWTALMDAAKGEGAFRVYNSPLSEAAVMGFDYGYSLDMPEGLTIWEAQFGDFANGAQVIIDQFLASSEDKWDRLSGLTLLLPHGYAGQGPEHSSARLERFLNLCAEDNMTVCNPTTPAQIFHLLRRQVVRPIRKPLIVLSPKSLLRHRKAASTLDDLSGGTFQKIIRDDTDLAPADASRVLICSGRLYYDLASRREELEAKDVAIVRFEQIYPLRDEEIKAVLGPYTKAEPIWVQDEPRNMGPWTHIQATIRKAMGSDYPLKVIARAASASPATGSKASHDFEAARLLELAFDQVEFDEFGSVLIYSV